MVMVKFSPEITEINGKSGNEIWRRDACMNHIEAYYYRHKHPTRKQQYNQAIFADYAFTWRKLLTSYERIAWYHYSHNHPVRNKKGEMVYVGGFQIFISFNRKNWTKGIPGSHWPPGYRPTPREQSVFWDWWDWWFGIFGDEEAW